MEAKRNRLLEQEQVAQATAEAQRVSAEHFLTLVETIPYGVEEIDTSGNILFTNSALEKLYEYEEGELIGRSIFDFLAKDSEREETRAYLKYLVREQPPPSPHFDQKITKTGKLIDAQVNWNYKRDEKGRLTGFISIISDITERKRAENALRQKEEDLRALVERAPYGIYRSNVKGKFEMVNRALVEMLGYDSETEVLALDLATQVYADARQRTQLIEQHRETDRWMNVEVDWKRKDGKFITVRLSGRTIPGETSQDTIFEVVAEDITQQRSLEQQVRHSQKMEAIGRLAGGIAHDFNNLLSVILGYSELLQARLGDEGVNQSSVAEIRKAAERANRLTQQLLAFSRKQVMQPKVLDLNTVVAGMEEMMRRLIGEHIELQARPGVNLEAVKADPGQMEQVLLNLAVNARDAMPDGGALTIETANVELDEAYARSIPGVKPGPYVMVAVSDTGRGMDKETLLHVFDPFFTTKGVGKGTGLGLATIYGIITQSGGHLWVHSEPGKGTTFKVYLPVAEKIEEGDVTTSLEEAAAGGGETILLVEDEKAVRELSRKILERSGYAVLEAADGKSALEIAKTYQGDIHILISDVIMPEMNGPELAEATRMLRPEMKVLFVSGYTDEMLLHQGEMIGALPFLQKPFTLRTLSQKVRETLDSKRDGNPPPARRGIPLTPERSAQRRARKTAQ